MLDDAVKCDQCGKSIRWSIVVNPATNKRFCNMDCRDKFYGIRESQPAPASHKEEG